MNPQLAQVEARIQSALAALLGGIPCLSLARIVGNELTPEEHSLLSPAQRTKWDALSATGSPDRRREWSEARRCEREIRSLLGPSTQTSIAHTRGEGIAAVVAVGAAVRLGVDVELRTREVKKEVAARFMREGEDQLGLHPLEIWVIKEALFKADPENAGTAISSHLLTAFDEESGQGSGQIADREAGFALIRTEDWILAVAVNRARESRA